MRGARVGRPFFGLWIDDCRVIGVAVPGGDQPVGKAWKEIDLDRHALLDGDVDHGLGDGEVLEADAGAVEEGDLVGGGAAGMGAVDDGADLGDVGLRDEARGDGVLGLADGDRLGDLVGEDGGLREQGGLDLLLALGVGAHAGEVGAGGDLVGLEDRVEARGDGDDDIGFGAEAVEIDGLEGQAELGCGGLEAREHLGVEVPADDLLEGALGGGGAHLEGRLVAGADHAEDLGVGAGEVLDRDRRGGGGAERREEVAADDGFHLSGVGIEEEDRGLVVGEALRVVAGPVAAGLEAEIEAGAVEAGLEAVERVGVADRLADDREVVGIALRHRCEDGLDGIEAGFGGDQVGDGRFGDDVHGRGLSGSRRGDGPGEIRTACRRSGVVPGQARDRCDQ